MLGSVVSVYDYVDEKALIQIGKKKSVLAEISTLQPVQIYSTKSCLTIKYFEQNWTKYELYLYVLINMTNNIKLKEMNVKDLYIISTAGGVGNSGALILV